MSLLRLELAAYVACALGAALGAFALVRTEPLPLPDGPRGRARARAGGRGLGLVDGLLRRLASLIAAGPLGGLRAWLDARLARGGDFLGLGPDELLALCLLGSAAGGGVGVALSSFGLAGAPPVGLVLGLLAPALALRRAVMTRTRSLLRALPGAIDLLALCMGAGLDFAEALALVVRSLDDGRAPLRAALERVLQELSLGRTRAQALAELERRAPLPAVRELVAAIVQADRKGSALAPVLAVQARVLRLRRSLAAEQAAARAAVLLIVPLMLLMSAILLVLFAPFAIEGLGL